METEDRDLSDSPRRRSFGRVLLDAGAEGVLNSILFCFRFFGWTVKWTFAVIFFVAIMALAGYFVFSEAVKGGGYVTVPDVVGMSVTDAANVLASQGLELGKQTHVVNDDVQEYRVLLQRPSANKVVRAGRPVQLTISAGSELKPAPNLVGQPDDVALAMLADASLVPGLRSRMPSNIPRDVVLGQYPPAGMEIFTNGEIHLLVSDGPYSGAMFMPDLADLPVTEALEQLARLKIQVVPYSVSMTGVEFDTVLAQEPEAGSLLTDGQEVSFDAVFRSPDNLSNVRRKVDVRYTVPDTSFRPDVRVDLIDSNQNRTTVYPNSGTAVRLAPATSITVPIKFAGSATVEFYADGALHRSYYYQGNREPVITDTSRRQDATQPVVSISNRPDPAVSSEDLIQPVGENLALGSAENTQIQVLEPQTEQVEKTERRKPRTSKSWRDP